MSIRDCHSGGGRSEAPIGPRSKWLALGIFYDADSIGGVLQELAAGGFGEEKLCIARLKSAERWAQGGQDSADGGSVTFGRLLRDAEEVRGASDDQIYVVSRGCVAGELCAPPVPPETQRVLCPPWMTASQCEQLVGHLRLGAAALVVKSESPAEQDACSRAMLRHSQQIVRTYDFFL